MTTCLVFLSGRFYNMATSPPSSEAFESSSPAHDDSSFNTSISSIVSHATTIINNISSTNNVQTLSSISTDFTTGKIITIKTVTECDVIVLSLLKMARNEADNTQSTVEKNV